MKKLKFLSLAIAIVSSAFLASCGNAPKEETVEETTVEVVEVAPPVEAPKTVVDIAVGSPDHTTLVAAVTAAGLVETLSGTGPFTIFAPTNAAFAALPAGTVDNLLKPESKDKLTSVLTYHVVSGNVMAADLSDGQVVKTLNGQDLKVSIKDGKVTINGAAVTAADLAGSNGVIHVVDAVLLPK
ncbi:fasciclin domain-containing protein [Aquiflexum sp. TKW24L]|uniref:fasciclin domain-containing protein n=1 Tax=Aquiflexum sp. TKW24L TaxID=2942212 RepID=UPI0020C0777C|nr:fasciclin domain-containing protein [Aquiflexum sp. TKW24L]MCL6260144.1 fasciclin domain-containing protein [Aquiflexum sp. TKW24L]